MTAQEMWNLFSVNCNIEETYQAWVFGTDPDTLAGLVLDGIKTATSSALAWYDADQCDLPCEGEYSVILNGKDEAVCIIRTTKVSVVPFDQVGEEFARKEGEGDCSLQYWQRAHEEFFTSEFFKAGMVFDYQAKIVCEEFVRVFP